MTPRHRQPRRRDRSRDEGWIRTFLHRGEVTVLAGISEGRPTCLPRLYAFDEMENALYLHGAPGGEVGAMLGHPPSESGRVGAEDASAARATSSGQETWTGAPVALTVFEMGRLLPAPEAAEFGVEYSGVVVFGRGRIVQDAREAAHALDLLMRKYAPHLQAGRDYEPIPPEDVSRTAVVRVDIEAWSGKERRAPEHFPGAYRLSEIRRRL